ncbi:hypothetical protein SDC9_72792 [bioreactor metagenome]|uniref:VanZ-like domain-containing protein n=1 Tax=bioreactor metagenome TaxID=1076179 RepID=A0A644YEI8_9ZZZZ
MTVHGIVFYTARAFALALPAGLLFLALRGLWLRRKGISFSGRKEAINFLMVFYLAALVQITVIRDWSRLAALWALPHSIATIQIVPLVETLKQSQAGPWAVIYPVAGNLLWFFPLGLLAGIKKPDIGAGRMALISFSLSLSIEFLQWVLGTGISDIDDVIFNVCGALAGLLSQRLLRRLYFPDKL